MGKANAIESCGLGYPLWIVADAICEGRRVACDARPHRDERVRAWRTVAQAGRLLQTDSGTHISDTNSTSSVRITNASRQRISNVYPAAGVFRTVAQ
jgi:hypothetical protein